MPRVVVLGSINTDLVVRLPRLPTPGETLLGGEFQAGPGGKGANQAVAARRAGAEVVLVAAVGDDEYGRGALEGYRREGIDVGQVRVVLGVASGVALIFVGGDAENMIGVAPGANMRLTPEDIDRLPGGVFEPRGVLLASLEVPLETVARGVRRAKQAGMTVVLNPAPADRRVLDLDILGSVDVLTPNFAEVRTLAGRGVPEVVTDDGAWRAAGDLLPSVAGAILVTLGSQGSILVHPAPNAYTFVPPFPVAAVDTVGAGDAFNGALAAGLAEGRPLAEAARRASAAAALAVTRPGAQAAMPRRDQIDRLVLSENP